MREGDYLYTRLQYQVTKLIYVFLKCLNSSLYSSDFQNFYMHLFGVTRKIHICCKNYENVRFEEKNCLFLRWATLVFTPNSACDGWLEISKHKCNAGIRYHNKIEPIDRPLNLELKSIILILIGKNDSNWLITQKLIDVTV